jgi:hypothetical protein
VTSKGATDGRDDVQRLTPTGTLGTKEDLSNFGATKLLGSDWAVKGAAVLPSNAMNLQPHGTLPKIEPARLLIEKGGTIVSKSDEGTQTIARQNLDGSIRFNDVKTLDQVVQSAGEDRVTFFDANGRSIEGKIALTPYHSLSETIGNILFNLGATGKTIQASAAPTQPIGGWILVHNVGVENITSSAGNVDLKAVAAAAGFSYTQHDDPKIADFKKEVKALKAWDIYIYSGHGTSRGNIVAYGPPLAGSKYSASLLDEYTIVPPGDLPSLMKMGDRKHDLHPNTMPVMCFFDACDMDPVKLPKSFIDAGSQVITHPRGRGESVAPVAKDATEAYLDALWAKRGDVQGSTESFQRYHRCLQSNSDRQNQAHDALLHHLWQRRDRKQ